MVSLKAGQAGPETTSAMMCRRTTRRPILRAREGAGARRRRGLLSAAGLERCFRDLQGVRLTPVPEKAQT